MNKKFALLAATGAAALGFNTQAATTWDLPSAYPSTNLHTENLAQFVKDVDTYSKGELKITLHSNASLFKAPEIKRAVQSNQAQIGEILLTNYANEDPIYALDGLPFLATGYDAAWKLYQAQKEALDKKLASQGMKLLYTVAWPPQGIYANKDIQTVDDLKGLKWRAYSPVTARIAELVGAQPVTIQQSELAQAMATGVVQAFMTSGSTGWDTKAYEYMKKFYDTQAWLPKNAVIMNKKAFDQLDEASRNALLKAGAEAEKRGWKLSEEKTQWYLDQLRKQGMEIIKPSDALMKGLDKVGETMVSEWVERAGPEGKQIIETFRAGK
ncbi:C4-dicarboxylate ABC transporter substrate-binding protein [Allopusillimonas soli]|uniref:TRAP transporter substrate-binding protein n=1 Tax=Allopusillimonas soli TaxID=659016 RepID=A0A853F7Q5_9BURK|nr:TRAP transporter substrate-binding protein [Allopusillimonas soli]NYT36625.1 TRAP transporter substrate-binding protein [Allopusillimonas soli]TEA75111.1 C4-dicarboxylate ABC transporter substrate-binding protein [Allopusillimonas soli]